MILDHQLEIRQIRESAEHFWKTRLLKWVTVGFAFDLHSLISSEEHSLTF